MAFTDIENLLAERLGFDIGSVGPRAIEAVIKRSMEKAGFSDPAAYGRMVKNDREAWNKLVDRVVIPETWFFRDSVPFKHAAGLAFRRIGSTPGKVIRILSCPCSTGEEPYSLVMAMLDAGLPRESFLVDAVDVSRRALSFAQQGVFHKRSFRNDGMKYRESYFDLNRIDGTWQLKPDVTSPVRFREGNIIGAEFLIDDAPYDIVFCRNLLIYLHLEARLRGMAALGRLVAPEGVLVLGHAEAIFAREHGFKTIGPAAAFTFVRSETPSASKPEAASRLRAAEHAGSRASLAPLGGAGTAPANNEPWSNVTAPSSTGTAISELVIARRLGDTGRLNEALTLCSQYLQRVPDSSEGHFLLGVFHDALGRPDLAASYFRKVLYLDPAHREALLHLALKQEALGDGSGAALLRARAQRARATDVSE